jgi:predicted metal-dependent hydrolase
MSARKDTKEYVEFKPYIEQLERNLVNVEIRESSSNTVHTSYTVNKGEQVVFCLRSKEISQYLKTSNIHDKNVIMYVALHEIAHVACPEYQHTPLFMKIFKFFTEVAIDIGLYDKIEFDITPHEYCGIMISESIV